MVWIPKHIQCWKGRERIAESRVVVGKAIYIYHRPKPDEPTTYQRHLL